MSTASAGLRSQASEIAVPELDEARFEILNAIGSGGMGTVYRAVQRSVGRHVAIKMLAPEHAANAVGLARFVREANAIARTVHPNIVQLIDFGKNQKGQLLLVMELLEGEPLRAVLRRERIFETTRAVFVASECLKALRAAHGAGVIHRDLKPENIFLQNASGDDHVKVLDFGVAKVTQTDGSDNNTTEGTLVGTLRYMPPEQIAGEPPDTRVDIYSVGMVLYEMLSGSMPYETRDRFVLMRQIIAEPPVHLHERAPHVTPELCDVVMRAIAKSARDRFDDADSFRRALLPFLDPSRARMEALSETSSRASALGSASSGPVIEYNSGVVRSGDMMSPVPALRSVPPGPIQAPSSRAQATFPPPADLFAQRNAAASDETSAPRRSNTPMLLALVLVGIVLAALAGLVVRSFTEPPTAATVPSPTPETRPAPVVQPVTPPVAAPAGVEPARPATRLVALDSRPTGARVSDLSGNVVCPTTPCAITVTVGEERALRVSLGSRAAMTVLDGAERAVTLTLSPAESAPAGNAQRPHNGPAHPHHPHGETPEEGEGELPMFLPHSGH